MGEKTAADRTGSARARGIPVYVPTRGEEPAIIERAKIKGRFRLPIKRKWSKRAAPLYADRFVVILYLRLSIVLYRPVAESADRFKRAAILYICGINVKLSFTYSGQKGARSTQSARTENFFVLSIEQSIWLEHSWDQYWCYMKAGERTKNMIFTSPDMKIKNNTICLSLQWINHILMNILFLFWIWK